MLFVYSYLLVNVMLYFLFLRLIWVKHVIENNNDLLFKVKCIWRNYSIHEIKIIISIIAFMCLPVLIIIYFIGKIK